MEFTKEQILKKVQKLMNLGHGTNFEGESATALNMARDLLAKHNLSIGGVVGNSPEEKVETTRAAGSYGWWQLKLATVVADFMTCNAMTWKISTREGYRSVIRFVGMPTEVEVCTYIYDSIFSQIIKLTQNKRKDLRKDRAAEGTFSRSDVSYYTRGYITGIIDFLDKSFRERKRHEASDCTALVLVKNPKVGEWMKENTHKVTTHQPSASDRGHTAGFHDGRKVSVNPGRGQSTTGKLRG